MGITKQEAKEFASVEVKSDRAVELLPLHVFFHICSTFSMFNTFGFPFANMLACGDMIFGGVMERFPKLKVAHLESGCGWVPFWLERMDEHWEHEGHGQAKTTREKPSFYFKRQCWASAEAGEELAPVFVEHVGDDYLLVATDYPHLDVKYPHAIDTFLKLPFSDQMKRKWLWDNCARMYSFE